MRKKGIEDTLQGNHAVLERKASLLFKLRENTERNTDLIGRMYDMQDQAKREAERDYKRELLLKKREHKEQMQNIKE